MNPRVLKIKMHDIQVYIAEAMRIRRTIQIYSEFFGSQKSLNILNNLSAEVTTVIRRSMHDEIIISLARLFDGKSYQFNNTNYEYLSQFNLIEKHKNSMTPALNKLREKTTELLTSISLKDYRNFKIAHNDKPTLTGDSPTVKHDISYEKITALIETSIKLMIGLMASINGKVTINIWADINDKNIGVGNAFIEKLSKIDN